jgi:hypothetical protein
MPAPSVSSISYTYLPLTRPAVVDAEADVRRPSVLLEMGRPRPTRGGGAGSAGTNVWPEGGPFPWGVGEGILWAAASRPPRAVPWRTMTSYGVP